MSNINVNKRIVRMRDAMRLANTRSLNFVARVQEPVFTDTGGGNVTRTWNTVSYNEPCRLILDTNDAVSTMIAGVLADPIECTIAFAYNAPVKAGCRLLIVAEGKRLIISVESAPVISELAVLLRCECKVRRIEDAGQLAFAFDPATLPAGLLTGAVAPSFGNVVAESGSPDALLFGQPGASSRIVVAKPAGRAPYFDFQGNANRFRHIRVTAFSSAVSKSMQRADGLTIIAAVYIGDAELALAVPGIGIAQVFRSFITEMLDQHYVAWFNGRMLAQFDVVRVATPDKIDDWDANYTGYTLANPAPTKGWHIVQYSFFPTKIDAPGPKQHRNYMDGAPLASDYQRLTTHDGGPTVQDDPARIAELEAGGFTTMKWLNVAQGSRGLLIGGTFYVNEGSSYGAVERIGPVKFYAGALTDAQSLYERNRLVAAGYTGQ